MSVHFVALALLVFVSTCVHGSLSEFEAENNAGRNGKAMFNLNSFALGVEKKQCTTSSNEQGVCYKRSDCTRMGGTPGDSCSNGGVCCMLRSMCSGNTTGEMVTVRRNLTHLVAPTNYMNANQCRFIIKKRTGVCQVRLDFTKFSLAPPTEGNCEDDVLTISGAANIPVFKMCGEAANQHLYLDFGSSESITISASLTTEGMARLTSTYDVLVTMIPCNSPSRAPDGCGQYYTQATGDVYSFNYYGGQQLNDQRYTVCIQGFGGASQIKWSKCSNSEGPGFFITGNPAVNVSQTGSDCSTDFVEIFGAGKYCGSDFTGVTSDAKPFTMYVRFNDVELQGITGPTDPTGCPLGWTCYNNNYMPKCGNPPAADCVCDASLGDSCVPPAYLPESDTDNNGFCLRYALSAY